MPLLDASTALSLARRRFRRSAERSSQRSVGHQQRGGFVGIRMRLTGRLSSEISVFLEYDSGAKPRGCSKPVPFCHAGGRGFEPRPLRQRFREGLHRKAATPRRFWFPRKSVTSERARRGRHRVTMPCDQSRSNSLPWSRQARRLERLPVRPSCAEGRAAALHLALGRALLARHV